MHISSSRPWMAGATSISTLWIEDMHGANFTTAQYLGEAGWVVSIQQSGGGSPKDGKACCGPVSAESWV